MKDKGTTYIKPQLQIGFASHLTRTVNNSSTLFHKYYKLKYFTGENQEIYFINSDNYIIAPEKLPLLFHTMVSACYFPSAKGYWKVSHHTSEKFWSIYRKNIYYWYKSCNTLPRESSNAIWGAWPLLGQAVTLKTQNASMWGNMVGNSILEYILAKTVEESILQC